MSRNQAIPLMPIRLKCGKSQQGSSLLLAIFVLVVMLLLGTALVRMLGTTSESIAYEVVGTRAYQAANIGASHRLSMIFPIDGPTLDCEGVDIASYDGATNDNTVPIILNSLNSVDGLKKCQVSALTCDDFSVDNVIYYRIRSTGQCDIDGNQTSRTVEVEARSL